jgi:elongator complex protein 1
LSWDAQNNSIIYTFGPTPHDPSIQISRLDPIPISGGVTDTVVNLQYFADTRTVCVVLRAGDLVLVREEPLPGEDAIEIVGTLSDGIETACWSPDEEILAILTGQSSLVLMSRDLQPLADVQQTSSDHKISKHVSVGWGKSETQFKGKRAKTLQDPTIPDHVDEGILSSQDDGSTEITWRGDGEYLAVNSIDDHKRRTIRVYSRIGTLDSVSEAVDGLEGALSWRPAGNIISGIKRLNDTAEVVFFERNGLRHGGFEIRQTPDEPDLFKGPIRVHWNADSTVLAVCFRDQIQLWTMGNYHFYLKQTIRLCGKRDGPAHVHWSSDKALLGAFYKDGTKSLDVNELN